MTKILILLSTYNGSKFLIEQLDSIRLQRGVDLSLLIRDDGSSDDTIKLIDNYTKIHTEFKIELIKGENCGSTMSFTKLLQAAAQMHHDGRSFDYYAFADQDDIWIENKLEVATNKLKSCDSSKPAVYCSNTYLYYGNINDVTLMHKSGYAAASKPKALIHNFGTGCTMVFNIQAIELYNIHTPDKIWMHDYLMYMIGVYLGDIIYDDCAYIYYRQHSNNQFGSSRLFSQRLKRWLNAYIFNNNKNNELMCTNFLDTYKSHISAEDFSTIECVTLYRSSFKNRLRLIFNKSIRFNSFFVDARVILRIILGRL